MSDSSELLTLRLALIAVIFLFVMVVAITMRSGLHVRTVMVQSRDRAAGPRLIVVVPAATGLDPGSEFEVAGDMTLGRDEGNGIILPDASVSGRHATIERVANGIRIVDLGSTNGTLVNGRRVDARGVMLKGDEQVVFGAVVLRYRA